MKKALYLITLLIAALCMQKVAAQDASIFPKGEIGKNTSNYTGTIWLTE